MKKLFFILPATVMFLGSCGNTAAPEDNALDAPLDDKESFDDAIVDFSGGKASTGEQYFFGVQAEVVEIDMKLREIDELDAQDAPVEEFTTTLDACIELIAKTRKSLGLYTSKDWPKRQELHDLTIEWVDAVEGLVNDYLRDLAEPMSGPDDDWTDSQIEMYEKYAEAQDAYFEVDSRWVDFQYVFAEANGFQLSDETIDMDALIEEDMGH